MEQVITDGQACKKKIIESVKQAKQTIRVAMAFFTDREIGNQLISAKEKGVDVRVILSGDPNNQQIREILEGEVDLTIYESNGRGIMHHKFCIIDNTLLLHGSYNYTYNATNNNQESLNITDSYSLITEYSEIFESLIAAASLSSPTNNSPMFLPKEDDNYLEKFTEQLKNHISHIFDDFNQNEIIEQGRKLSEENSGQESVFIAYLDSSLARVNNRLNQDDQTRTIVKTRMTASLDRAKETNNRDLESDLGLLSNHCNEKKAIIQQKIETLKDRKKEKQEEYNSENAEASRIKSTIAELNEEIDGLDRQIVVRRFWTFPTVLKLVLTLLFFAYLSLFFASAIWKIFFEEEEILRLLARGLTPESPPLFDANAMFKIYAKKGIFYGGIATFFFIIPVLLTSIKLLGKQNKFVEILIGWIVGIFAIDVVVAVLISQHTFEIRQLLVGGGEEWKLSSAYETGEFWLIFIFGALPLFLTKVLLENIWTAYNNSNPEAVDREKTLLRNSKKRKLSEMQLEYSVSLAKLETITSEIDELKGKIIELEDVKNEINSFENNKKFELKERNEKKNKNLTDIFNSFIASVESGNKQFLQNVVSGRITAFKQGYFSHIISYYSESQSKRRIESLELAHNNWIKRNFE